MLCGSPAQCCEVGEDCVEGACAAACASDIRCGSKCCDAGTVCLADKCETPGADCNDSYDCAEGEFCEVTLDKCLPSPADAKLCAFKPTFAPFDPVIEWSWTSSPIFPKHVQVFNVPIVVDLDSDGVPEVLAVTTELVGADSPGYLRALDGATGAEKWPATADVYKPENQVNPRGCPAAADIDDDGKVDIVAPKRAGGVIAFNGDGSLKWKSVDSDGATPFNEAAASVAISIAHMDAGGGPEITYGAVVLDNTGKVISGKGRAFGGTNSGNYGAISIIADIDGDGAQEVVTGKAAYHRDGTVAWNQASLSDGYTAVADFDADGAPELVVVSAGQLRIQNAKTGALITKAALSGTGNGGPPTIDDFDADGALEIATSNGTNYNLFEYDPAGPTLSVKWTSPTQDASSNVTGSSVFDFEGDGSSEVVYGDECYFRVFSGLDGTVLFQDPSSSATIHEYPVVVDVDGDNNTEIVVVSNDSALKCAYKAGEARRHGVFVYGDKNDRWVRTRKIWNQHAYHATNILSDGTLPKPEPMSWVPPTGYNDYRVSQPGEGAFNAPDLKIDLEISSEPCPGEVALRARVSNAGSMGVPAGVDVDFHFGPDAKGDHVGSAKTTKALLPGESEVVTVTFKTKGQVPPYEFFATVDGGTAAASTIDECNEDNNDASAGGVACPAVQ